MELFDAMPARPFADHQHTDDSPFIDVPAVKRYRPLSTDTAGSDIAANAVARTGADDGASDMQMEAARAR